MFAPFRLPSFHVVLFHSLKIGTCFEWHWILLAQILKWKSNFSFYISIHASKVWIPNIAFTPRTFICVLLEAQTHWFELNSHFKWKNMLIKIFSLNFDECPGSSAIIRAFFIRFLCWRYILIWKSFRNLSFEWHLY